MLSIGPRWTSGAIAWRAQVGFRRVARVMNRRRDDEYGDLQDLRVRCRVNGETLQDGTTADMIFGVHHLVRYLSRFMVLRPGDVINTGTPAGVALGRPDAPYLRAGDVVELEIEGLGRQRQVLGQA